MDGNISKALWIGVSFLLFIAVVTVGLTVFGGMKNASGEAGEKINAVTQSMADEGFRPFDGKEVKGENVISAIRDFSSKSGEVIVLVCTLGKNSGTSLSIEPTSTATLALSQFDPYVSGIPGGSLSVKDSCWTITSTSDELFSSKSSKIQDADLVLAGNSKSTTKYINPAGKFKAYLIYDANQVIKGILCSQMSN